ncbi:MAG: AsmA family protein [Burkholderiales bacterium]
MTASDTPTPTPTPPHRRHSALAWTAGVLIALVLGAGVGEWAGWPFLAQPAERWLSQKLQRRVSFDDSGTRSLRLHLLGGIGVQAGRLQIDNPAWSALGPMLDARDADLRLRWRDLLAMRAGQPMVVQSLSAQALDIRLERRADGSASWLFAEQRDAPDKPAFAGLRLQRLLVREGHLHLLDAVVQTDTEATFSVADGAALQPGDPPPGVQAEARGHYRNLPLKASLKTGAALPWLAKGSDSVAVPVLLKLAVGDARLDFDGQVRGLLDERQLQGRYRVSGPSLAAVGEPLKLTLPSTRAFNLQGQLDHAGSRWHTVVQQATVGQSRLAGEFTFDAPAGRTPSLTGELRGPVLLLQDLGPAVGVTSPTTPATLVTAATPAAKPRSGGRVLPDRHFDLPSLRAMNAQVTVALDRLDWGTAALQSARPLRGQLKLQDGVLQINDIDARLAQGRLSGSLQLDGRAAVAKWQAHLAGRGLKIEQWIQPLQRASGPPYATGRLGLRVDLSGEGRSTAELLASADGRMVLHWTQGTVSHLAVEAAGLDIAQALGMLLRGDEALQVSCGVGDLSVRDGRVTPRVLLVDTSDSTLWIEGSMSLVTERLALTAHMEPKDWSPLALRTPVRLEGSLAQPVVSLEKGPLVRRLVPAALLAMINPLAAVLPLIDPGSRRDDAGIKACRDVAARYRRQGVVGIG